jgi:predicted dehydrogenase
MLRIGIVSAAHMHCWGYASAILKIESAQLSGVWDEERARGQSLAEAFDSTYFSNLEELLNASDAVVITSENKTHLEHIKAASAAGKPILCEKPIVADAEAAAELRTLDVRLMTAFPCRYSPAFTRLKQRVDSGEIGKIQAICATNRGRCPFGWFTEPEKSGGGAMIDHVVHVADLLHVLLGERPVKVQAQTGSNMYGQTWEDTAMLTLEYPSGVFATLDSSWSRPASYKTWGDVTMNVVGEKGVIELDMFGQAFDVYGVESPTHRLGGFGSDLDLALVRDFVEFANGDAPAPISAEDGLAAVEVALAGYRSIGLEAPAAV